MPTELFNKDPQFKPSIISLYENRLKRTKVSPISRNPIHIIFDEREININGLKIS